ncbi:aldo/keto reductase [Lyngbya sp. CCY1209]|jgi:aryl-alcohol dehydrogenase-like predicted oxidoreductase|uniref:aldo/keto reductase n=1 Tax=Lyngbya sp. CCY1209 TaxID=2886103 RepID=UPI002D218057|nr:aldo/keto reductase [Lyngbya sp. CCY1209]MEB3882359.1 aldo/keto reductase [Lyngbya sp. CCY1209]
METRSLGTSDIQMTPVILGTWQADTGGWRGVDESELVRAIRDAVEAGITTIDTAEVYASGRSEQLIAEAVSDLRDRVVYASKVFADHLKYDQVLAACDRSLKRLKTDYIDLYQIHWPSGAFNSEIVPIGETMDALNTLKEKGKIRAIGVSNFSRSQMEEAARYGRIDSLQPPYSLFWRDVERETMPYCVENNISILAYSSLAQGLLTGKFGPDHQFQEGDHRNKNKLFQNPDHYRRVQEALDRLRPIAAEKGCTLAQLSLAWLIARPRTHAIAGARNSSQVEQNVKAAEVRLSPEDLENIDRIGRIVTDHLEEDYPIMWNFG